LICDITHIHPGRKHPAKADIQPSFSTFRKPRENGAYYADKADMLKECLITNSDATMLFTQPHGFGKTLMMTMLRDFLGLWGDAEEVARRIASVDEYPLAMRYERTAIPPVNEGLPHTSGDTFRSNGASGCS